MYITDSNQYAIQSETYLLVLVVYFYEFIVYILLERNAFDLVVFFLNVRHVIGDRLIWKNPVNDYSLFLLAFKQLIMIIETMQLRIFES